MSGWDAPAPEPMETTDTSGWDQPPPAADDGATAGDGDSGYPAAGDGGCGYGTGDDNGGYGGGGGGGGGGGFACRRCGGEGMSHRLLYHKRNGTWSRTFFSILSSLRAQGCRMRPARQSSLPQLSGSRSPGS